MFFFKFFFNILNNSSFFYVFFTFTPLISAINIKSVFDNFFGVDEFISYIMQKYLYKKYLLKKNNFFSSL